jgi:lipopolysaccharide transport protein LptA
MTWAAKRLALLVLCAPLTLLAQSAPGRLSGPVTITAKNGEWQDGVMIYTGEVVMLSKTLELRGERMEMRQSGGKKSPYEILLTGSPATMKHLGATEQDPAVNGRGSKLVYRSATQTIELTGQAHLERGNDELTGERVRYDVAARRVQASGGDKGQVRIVIDVPEQP